MDSKGYAHSDIPEGLDAEGKIRYLEEEVRNLSRQMHLLNLDINSRIDGVEQQVKVERDVRISEVDRVKEIVAGNAVSGVVLAELALVYFLVSCACLTFPLELSGLLGWGCSR